MLETKLVPPTGKYRIRAEANFPRMDLAPTYLAPKGQQLRLAVIGLHIQGSYESLISFVILEATYTSFPKYKETY